MLKGRRWQGKHVILLFFSVFLQKGPLLSAFTPISKAHFTFLLQQLQHEGPSGRGSRGKSFPEDCGQEGGVCGHYGQVDDDDDDGDEDEDDEDDDVEDCGKECGIFGHYGQVVVEDILWTVHTILFMFSQ